METLLSVFTGVLRFVLPVMALAILATCIISLFRNRPRVHKIAQLVDQNNGSVIDIEHWETSIGKSKSNDVVLPLAAVSRFHAVIAKKKDDWTITDTFSHTGVLVNGKKIDGKAVIEDGDIITIGAVVLKFLCAEAISAKSKTAIRSQANTQPQDKRNIAYGVLVDVKSHKPIYIRKQDVIIGRGANTDIQIMSQAVSAEHARMYITSRGWALTDLDSHNGTKLNGRFINEAQLIFDEDLITFGDKVFIFYEK